MKMTNKVKKFQLHEAAELMMILVIVTIVTLAVQCAIVFGSYYLWSNLTDEDPLYFIVKFMLLGFPVLVYIYAIWEKLARTIYCSRAKYVRKTAARMMK